MFLQGEILKSKKRSEDYPKFVMVLFDRSPSHIQFNAVVIFCKSCSDELSEEDEVGYVTNNWNTSTWERSSWEEVKRWI